MQTYEMFVIGNNIECAVYCKHSIPAKIYTRNMVCFMNIIVKTEYVNDNKHKNNF